VLQRLSQAPTDSPQPSRRLNVAVGMRRLRAAFNRLVASEE